MNDFMKAATADFFHTRTEADYNKMIKALEEGCEYDILAKLDSLSWPDIMKLEQEDLED